MAPLYFFGIFSEWLLFVDPKIGPSIVRVSVIASEQVRVQVARVAEISTNVKRLTGFGDR